MTADTPFVSVVVRSRDEADRLRLTLAALACQSEQPEVVVVDDGSVDGTRAVLADAAGELRLRVVSHTEPRGRSGASNAGARAATGAVLLFLDGDTLANPRVVQRHAAVHRTGGGRIGRGETWHLRCTRWLLDPETGRPRPAEAARFAALSAAERDAMRVTRAQVTEAFGTVESRAQPGIYPGIGPRLLHQAEMDALRHYPDCDVLWAAASGNNLSVERRRFLDAGGFDERLDINEHRELALRLCQAGGRMVPIEGAATFHMTHRSGWRDPLHDTAWLDVCRAKHPGAPWDLLPRFWAGLSDPDAPIRSLPELARAARAEAG